MDCIDRSDNEWQYINDTGNNSRFLLGQILNQSQKVFLWFGINPSTATPNNLDATLKRVKAMSKYNNNDQDANWLMANVYPQRSTNPNYMHQNKNEQLHKDNLTVIENVMRKYKNITVVLAYGNLINKRKYLNECLNDIKEIIRRYNPEVKVLSITAKRNPHHPIGEKNKTKFIDYKI